MAERVWERFLTEQDKQHLGGRDRRPVGFGDHPALLLIDLYRWVFGDGPEPLLDAVRNWPGSCGPAAWGAIPYIQTLLAAAREAGIPVIHLTGLEDALSGVAGWSDAAHHVPALQAPLDTATADRRRRRYDIVDEVGPTAGEAVLRKAAPSAFWGTPLAAHLNHLGVDTIITCGESTSGCVRASVVEGCTYRYRMIVVEECVFDRHEATHAINLFDMHQKYADVISLAEATEFLRSWKVRQGNEAAAASGGMMPVAAG
ncbi:MAG TPA: isochorismatase family protein [Dehalococcoidia bacterium]|nr:isochorismatase family protein [Dehalococcoidia bacterium]